ncbi:MAG: aldo/keto reductase, partial [Solobacterium sp.]|nr:aldo/keto reductase [Solobacterium sp.]
MKKLGFGTMRLPLFNPNDSKTIDLEQFKKMTDLFLERGFTYFDTAYPYHEEHSELAVREALVKRHSRDSFLLADK